MKILSVTPLAIPDIKVIRFGRFCDQRGYFTEPFRRSDLKNHPEIAETFANVEFVQMNESLSRSEVLRGLHFQWNPFMGKLVRTMAGHMVDIVLDIRKGSPTYGKGLMYDMPASLLADYCEWIWVPPGFAHGNYFLGDTVIEYLCAGEYSQGCEACIAPYAEDIDWSLCEPHLKARFDSMAATAIMTDKDRSGLSFAAWDSDPRSENFIFGKC